MQYTTELRNLLTGNGVSPITSEETDKEEWEEHT